MTFDPLKFYEDGKRRESRWSAVTPFILVGLLLLVMGVDGYLGYKSVKPRPKPQATSKTQVQQVVGTHWQADEPTVIPYTKLKADDVHDEVYHIPFLSDAETDALSRKWHLPHKHKAVSDPFRFGGSGKFFKMVPTGPYESWRLVNTVPSEWDCTRRTKTSGMDCQSRPLTPAEIAQYKSFDEKPRPSDDGTWYYQPRTAPEISPTLGICDLMNCGYSDHVLQNVITRQPEPSCVMPADIDVCPIQMLDPKAADDKKVKP